MESSNGLLGSSNQIFLFITGFIGLIVFAHHLSNTDEGDFPCNVSLDYLVEFVIELTQLSHFLHHFLSHEERCIENLEIFVIQDVQCQLNDCLFEKHCWTLKINPPLQSHPTVPSRRRFIYLHEITTRSSDCRSSFSIVPINHVHEIEMRVLLSCFHITGGSLGDIVILEDRSCNYGGPFRSSDNTSLLLTGTES